MNPNSFLHHIPSTDTQETIARARGAYDALYKAILELPPNRERSLAITNLEQSAMWLIKGLVINDPESKVVPLPPEESYKETTQSKLAS